jgi:GTP 3',8-cyclase
MKTAAAPLSKTLRDPFGRVIDYVRVSVTDRCDLRCFYCLPKGHKEFQNPEDSLSFDEIERVIRAFAALGVRRARITGGEPLVRRDIPALVRRLARIPGIDDLSLSTNGTQLKRHAAALKGAGIARINVSLDTLRAERFAAITGGRLEQVLAGLMAAKEHRLQPVKINMVVMKDVNDDEVEDMLGFCLEHGFTLRFIETMPTGSTGRSACDHFLDLGVVKERLQAKFDLTPSAMRGGGPAQYLQVAGTDMRIGFITPMSQHFCATCNRVRLGADGTLYMCLGQDHSLALRPLLRSGIGDAELEQILIGALALKPERHEFRESPDRLVRFMSVTGG